MADIINLRRARKLRARQDADERAEANRIAFGRSKVEKRETKAVNALADRVLDGHWLGDDAAPSTRADEPRR